jgi:hypothetical protein
MKMAAARMVFLIPHPPCATNEHFSIKYYSTVKKKILFITPPLTAGAGETLGVPGDEKLLTEVKTNGIVRMEGLRRLE